VQHPVATPLTSASTPSTLVPASLAYNTEAETNRDPFILSPILNLPLSFGSAYVGETFSCTLCANNDIADGAAFPGASPKRKTIRDVRVDAEMKTPGAAPVQKLELTPDQGPGPRGEDLEPGQTLQKVVNFDLKEEGNHVLAVTVSYYEATETSGKTRTFRKLYQFICKASLIVRTKIGPMTADQAEKGGWILEAQLENCSEDVIQLEKVMLDLEAGFKYTDCNWETSGSCRPILHPGEVEQVCFIVWESDGADLTPSQDGKIILGVLGIGWRGEMGNKGFLSTGKLGPKPVR
jgi:trafficking protein particle complex subunit 13